MIIDDTDILQAATEARSELDVKLAEVLMASEYLDQRVMECMLDSVNGDPFHQLKFYLVVAMLVGIKLGRKEATSELSMVAL